VLAQLIWLLPMLVAIKFFVAVFRGKANAKAKLFFEDILYQSSRLLLLILFCLLGLQLAGVIWAYLLSALLAAVGFALFAFRQIDGIGSSINLPATGQLLRFSLPLLLVELMVSMYKLVATLALGVWSTADQVALYNAPLRAASFINLPLEAMLFLYLPVASRLFAQGKLAEAGELYVSTSKWIFMLALPLCLACVLDGRFLLGALYGRDYAEAWPTLLVLGIGLGLHNFLGANGNAMVSLGYTSARLSIDAAGTAGIARLCLLADSITGRIGCRPGCGDWPEPLQSLSLYHALSEKWHSSTAPAFSAASGDDAALCSTVARRHLARRLGWLADPSGFSAAVADSAGTGTAADSQSHP
jgi:O-antigen/teichoic acid export membrane protein